MRTIDRRLATLEQQRADEDGVHGIRWFQESHDTAGIFYEIQGTTFYDDDRGYTRSDLNLLKQDWQLVIVVYHSPEITEAL